MCFFRGENGSALTWFVNRPRAFLWLIRSNSPISPMEFGKKDEKNGGALVCLPTRRKPSNGAGCAIKDGNVQLARDTAVGQQN
jgi:hypothetical protein